MAETAFTIIEPTPGEWRSADIDTDNMPLRLRFHSDASISPVDAIYMGRVTRVEKTLDMAFLDLGNGLEGNLTFRRARALSDGKTTGIADCAKEGDLLKVQVVHSADTAEGKSAALTARPRLLGRYVVVESGKPRVNISKDISARKTKDLLAALAELKIETVVIVRSSADMVEIDTVLAEATFLAGKLLKEETAPGLMHAWQPQEQSLLAAPHEDTPIYCENGSILMSLRTQAKAHWPDLNLRLQQWKGETKESAFEECGVEEAIEEALSDRINLPSGGWINITPTPALTAIDVNMGGALAGRPASEVKLITNMEATLALAFHMQFQDLGGLIVVDYIDMPTKGHAKELMTLIERTMREDRVPVQHTGISMFGLVEYTRKRSGLTLQDRTYKPRGRTLRSESAALRLLRAAMRLGSTPEPGALVLKAPQPVQAWLQARPALILETESATHRKITFEEGVTPETYIAEARS